MITPEQLEEWKALAGHLIAHGGRPKALRVEPQLMGKAAAAIPALIAEIDRLRHSDAEVIVRILANTPPGEWLSKHEISRALEQWKVVND